VKELSAGVKEVCQEEVTGGDNVAVGNSIAGGGPECSPEQGSLPKLLRNIRGIIFDFDGTLFDNVLIPFYLIAAYPPDWLRIWRERLVRKDFTGRDYSSPQEYYRAFFATFGKACSRSPERIRNWYFNRYMPRMIRVLKKHYKPRPGVSEVFRLFDNSENNKTAGSPRPNVPKAAVYSDYPFLKERLEALGLPPGPGIRLYGPESFGAQKPAVRPFRVIAGDLGVESGEVLVIGDRENTDGLGAFKAGMHFFCLETGRKRYFRLDPYRRPEKEKPHGPSLMMYAGAWDELVKLLNKEWGYYSK